MAGSVPVLGLVIGSIPSPCLVRLSSKEFGNQSCPGCSRASVLYDLSDRSKLALNSWYPHVASRYTFGTMANDEDNGENR